MTLLAGNRKTLLYPTAAPFWVQRADGVPAALAMNLADGRYWYRGRRWQTRDDMSGILAVLAGSFARASTADRTNASGLLESVASGASRFDYDPVLIGTSNGLWLEGARTNLCIRAQELDNAAWAKGKCTISANAATAPDGNAVADKIVEDNTAGVHYAAANTAITITSLTVVTVSAYVEAAGRTAGFIGVATNSTNRFGAIFNLSAGTIVSSAAGSASTIVGSGIEALSNGWYRVWVTGTQTSTSVYPTIAASNSATPTLDANGMPTYTGDASSGLYVFGMQCEVGGFASSYIPTTTTSVTRAADSLTRTRTNPTTIAKLIKARTAAGAGTQVLWQIDDGTADNHVRVLRNSSNEIHVVIRTGASDVADLNLGSVAANTAFNVAFRAGTNDYAASLNGAAVVTDASGTMPTGLVNERFSGDYAGANNWYRHVSVHAEWAAASNAALQGLAA